MPSLAGPRSPEVPIRVQRPQPTRPPGRPTRSALRRRRLAV